MQAYFTDVRALAGRAAGLSLLLGALSAATLCAEKRDEDFDPRVYLETEDEASGVLRAAWRARNAEPPNWRVAIEKYLEVARDYGHTVYAQTDRLYLPMRVLVRRELASLPKEGKELYKVLKSREAEMAYRRALAAGSRAALEKIPASYPCLPPAPRALYLLGELSRAHGEPGRAVYYWQRLMTEYPDWEEGNRAALAARSALVAAEAGRRAEGERLLLSLKRISGLAKLRVGSRELIVADEIKRRLRSAGPSTLAAKGEAGFWPSMGGGPSHDGIAMRVVDAGVRRWQKKLGGAPKTPRTRHNYRQPYRPPATLPRRHPVCAGGMVFLAGDTDLIAVRAMSGHIVWPASKNSHPNYQLPCTRMTLPAVGDGKVFVALGSPQRYTYAHFRRTTTSFRTSVTLRAYALSGGKLRWESGRDEDQATREALKELDLVSSPVYSGGYVYCPAVKRGSISDAYMLCFDAADGRLAWKRRKPDGTVTPGVFVCAGHPVRAGYSYRSYDVAEDALPPAVGEGLVAFVTNLGAVAVMDASTGGLLWVYLYDRVENQNQRDRFGRVTAANVSTWAASAPIIRSGMLYAAPQDSAELLALELATGRLVWKSRRGKLKHMVGLSGDHLVCSGDREVVAFSARTGKRLWRGLLSGNEAGLGLVGKDFAVIPSSVGLQRFDLRTGKLVAKYQFKDGSSESGNLLISGDVMVSVGKSAVGGYYSWEVIVAKLKRQIAAKPEQAGPRAELAEVHFSGERYAEAADYFKQALARVRKDERAGGALLKPVLLRQIWESHSRLGKAREKESKFQEALKNFEAAHTYAGMDPERMSRELMTGYMRFARCREGLKTPAAAVSEYQKCIYTSGSYTSKAGKSRYYAETYDNPSGSRVMAGPFAKAQIDRLVREHGRGIYSSFEDRAGKQLGAARKERSIAKAEKLIEWYPNSDAVSATLILLSELHAAAGKHSEASARLREHLWKRPKSPRELEVRARLALSYQAQGMGALSRSMMRRMMRSWKDGSFKIGEKAWTVQAFVKQHMPEGKLTDASGLVPEIGGRLKTAWRMNPGGSNVLVPKAGPHDLTGLAFIRQNWRDLVAVDLKTGKRVWTKSGLNAFGRYANYPSAVASSSVVAVASGTKLVGLAPSTGRAQWETEILKTSGNVRLGSNNYCMLASGEGVVVAAPSWYGYDAKTRRNVYNSSLVVLDENTGKRVWSVANRSGMSGGLILHEGTVYAATCDQLKRRSVIDAYEVADGSKRFSVTVPGIYYAQQMQMHAQGDLLLVTERNSVHCYDTVTGKLKWRNRSGSGQNYMLAVDDSRVVVTSYAYNRGRQSLTVVAWDLETGKKLWGSSPVSGYFQNLNYQFMRMGYVPKPAASTAKVVVSYRDYRSRRQTTAAYNGKTGKLLWRTVLPANAYQSPALVGKEHAAVVVNNRGRCERWVWNLGSGKLVEKSPATYGFLTVQEGAVLQASTTGVEKLVPVSPRREKGGKSGR
jgi:outer membrane protein assembly factor BamB